MINSRIKVAKLPSVLKTVEEQEFFRLLFEQNLVNMTLRPTGKKYSLVGKWNGNDYPNREIEKLSFRLERLVMGDATQKASALFDLSWESYQFIDGVEHTADGGVVKDIEWGSWASYKNGPIHNINVGFLATSPTSNVAAGVVTLNKEADIKLLE